MFKNKSKTVVALGFFDSVHLGHEFVIKKAVEIAKSEENTLSAAFTFSDNPYKFLKINRKEIFTFNERSYRIKSLGVDFLISLKPSVELFNLNAKDFINYLFIKYNVCHFVCGEDYTFGHNAQGNVESLKAIIDEINLKFNVKISLTVIKLLNKYNQKIASSQIYELLKDGKIEEINSLLIMPYSISGKVIKGRSDGGKKLGFPTANIDYPKNIQIIKPGVYATIVEIDKKNYKAMTNVGSHPTFLDHRKNIESHIFDFNKDIYGKDIRINFYKKLRDIIAFDSSEELIKQLKIDLDTTKKLDF